MPTPGQCGPEPRKLGGWNTLEVPLDRHQVHEDVHGTHVENRGNEARLDDLQIGQTGIFGDQERSGPHDRGKDLAPCTCRRLDAPGLFGTVADLFHEGNRERPASYDVGDGTARHGSHRGRSHNRCFRWSSPLSSGDRISQVDEELAGTRDLEQGSEQDEDEDEGGGHTKRDPVYPFLAKIKLSHHPSGAVASMPKHAGECGTRIRVADETGGDERNGPSHRPTARFEKRDDCHYPRKNVGGVPGPRPVHDGVQVERQIEGCENGAGNESDIQRPCHATSGWEGATLRWKEEKGQNLNEREMECPLVEESEWADAGYVELEKREGDRQNDEGPCGKAREPQVPPPDRGPASRSHRSLSTDVDIGTPHREEIRRSGTSYPASTK